MPALCNVEMNMNQDRRKKLRLKQYDYSSSGAYFVTICTYQRAALFGPVGRPSEAAERIVEVFKEVLSKYSCMNCSKYVVMPDHFHALLVIDKTGDAPEKTLSEFMGAFKSKSTVAYIHLVKAGKAPPFAGKLWQRSYYDHVIRNEQDFLEVWKYIEENPLRWQLKRQKDL